MTSYKSTINLFFYDALLYEFQSWSQFSFAFGLDCTPYKTIDSIVLSQPRPQYRGQRKKLHIFTDYHSKYSGPKRGGHDYVIGSISWY